MSDVPDIPRGLKYVLIPADRDKPLKECALEGQDDDTLKREIENYFRVFGITAGQENHMRAEMLSKVKSKVGANKDGAGDVQGAELAMMNACLDDKLSKYEIVPIIMPTRQNDFVGRSLYIDEIGRFKELPLNERASQIAQRDIRGDCFVLSNRDNPSLDKWERVHTTVDQITTLIHNPPAFTPDPMGATGQQSILEKQRDETQLSHVITADEIEEATEKKHVANRTFQAKKYTEAIDQYTDVLEKMRGSTASLNADQVGVFNILRTNLLTNRALSYFHNQQYKESVQDCQQALEINGDRKAHTIMIRSVMKLRDFERSIDLCDRALESYPEDATIGQLRATSVQESVRDKNKEKDLFRGMFRN